MPTDDSSVIRLHGQSVRAHRRVPRLVYDERMFALGTLSAEAASARADLLAPSVLALLTAEGLLDSVGVVEIDPEVSDTAATRERYELPLGALANCVIVGGRRGSVEKAAGVVVLASTRADVTSTAERLLDVRRSKILIPGRILALLPEVRVVEGLGRDIADG